MPLIDQIVAWVTLTGLIGVLTLRSILTWREFRIQRRAFELLVRSMTEFEAPEHQSSPR